MDSSRSDANEELTFLTHCVSDEMTAPEAAGATMECWTEAESALAPVIGRDGLAVVLRQSEQVAIRKLGLESPGVIGASIEAFCDWAGALSSHQAVVACKTLLSSIERYLAALVGARSLQRLLRRGSD